MSSLISPEFVDIGEEVDIKSEPLEEVTGPNLRTDIFDNHLEEDIPDSPDPPPPQEEGGELSCPICPMSGGLTHIESHLFAQHCSMLGSTFTYPCELVGCSFKSLLRSALVLHYFGHVDEFFDIGLSSSEFQNGSNSQFQSDLEVPEGASNFVAKFQAQFTKNVKQFKNGNVKKKVPGPNQCLERGCSESFLKSSQLRLHVVKEHQLKGQRVNNYVPFWSCSTCSFPSLTKFGLGVHLKESQGCSGMVEYPVQTPSVFKKFKSNEKLPKNSKKSDKIKYRCNEPGCGSTFSSLAHLRMHNVNDHQLQGHKVLHPVPFWSCDTCGLSTLTKLRLTRHLKASKTCQGMSPFCQPSLENRVKKKYKEKPKIEVVLKRRNFDSMRFMKRYFDLVKGLDIVDLYQCPHCNERFSKAILLNKHINIVHRVQWSNKERSHYKSIAVKCKRRGFYQCKQCAWVGTVDPWSHLKRDHEDSYNEMMEARKQGAVKRTEVDEILPRIQSVNSLSEASENYKSDPGTGMEVEMMGIASRVLEK